MRGFPAKSRLKTGLFLAFALTAGLSLAACSDIDSMFGDDTTDDMSAADAAAPTAGSVRHAAPGDPRADIAAPAPVAAPVGGPPAAASRSPPSRPVAIEPGSDTGTAVNKTIQTLRGQVVGPGTEAGRQCPAPGRPAQQRRRCRRRLSAVQGPDHHPAAGRHHQGQSRTGGQWNTAQASLDALSANINQLNALGTDVTNDSSTAHFALDQIGATFNVSGAVDEDHRQLSLLEDETSQTIVLIDRLLKEVSDDVQRQTAYVANERGNLTRWPAPSRMASFMAACPAFPPRRPAGGVQLASAGTPLVVIRFDHPDVDYQQILYAALNQALQARPNAGFEVVAVAPTRGNAASVQIAQTTARRHAQEVMRSMTDMGVPATRMGVASATDPAAAGSEVRVFVR